jgi:hypothetical protein
MVFPFFKSTGRNDASQQAPVAVDPTFNPSPILLKKIQAFQTITTFLGQLQRQALIRPYDLKGQHSPVSVEYRTEIQLCDAFAHLAVMQHDVVAVSTSRDNNQMKIVACSSTSTEEDMPSDPTQKLSILQRCLNFFCTKNTRYDEEKSESYIMTTHPYIIEAKAPDGYPETMERETLIKYLNDLEKKW